MQDVGNRLAPQVAGRVKIDTELVSGVISAVATTAAGLLAWQAARAASKAAERSAKATENAEEVRQWERRTPELQGSVNVHDERQGTLTIRLDGPLVLTALDRVTVQIVEEEASKHPNYLLNPDLTPEQIAAQLWTMYRFIPHSEGVDGRGQTYERGRVEVGDDITCRIERTPNPSWVQGPPMDYWAEHFGNQPLRLRIKCEQDGREPWELKLAVPTPGLRSSDVREKPA